MPPDSGTTKIIRPDDGMPEMDNGLGTLRGRVCFQ